SNGRMEYRVPDAAVNPYLSHTLIIAAMEDGLNRQLDPGLPDAGDGSVGQLPLTLGDAVEAFGADTYLTSHLPAGLVSIYTQLKQEEWARYCGAITEWERGMYWGTIP
ncbi:glutamine synthetase, partial [Arthrobacter deserti]|nr:glutamine synthetase [Arthrobacter deserti]